MEPIRLSPIDTVTMSFNAKCGKGKVLKAVKSCTSIIQQHLRWNILQGNIDVPSSTRTVADGKVQKSVTNVRNSQVAERVGTVDGKGVYLMYRLRPFKPLKSRMRTNMNNAIVLRWGDAEKSNQGNKSIKIFTNGVITSAGWVSEAEFRAFVDKMLDTVFRGAKLESATVATILHNTGSVMTTDDIDCYALLDLVAQKTPVPVDMGVTNVYLRIKAVEGDSRKSRIQVHVNGHIKVFSSTDIEHLRAWNFVETVILPCVNQLKQSLFTKVRQNQQDL